MRHTLRDQKTGRFISVKEFNRKNAPDNYRDFYLMFTRLFNIKIGNRYLYLAIVKPKYLFKLGTVLRRTFKEINWMV